MPLKPGTANTIEKHTGVGGVVSITKDPFIPIETGKLHLDYCTLCNVPQSAITQANPGVLTKANHGLATNDLLIYRREGGGGLQTSLGTHQDGDYFYAKVVDADTFQLTSAPDGTGLEVTNDGGNNQTFSRAIGKVT